MKHLKTYIQESQIDEGFFQSLFLEGFATLVTMAIWMAAGFGCMGTKLLIEKIYNRIHNAKEAKRQIKVVEEFLNKYPSLKDENGEFMKAIRELLMVNKTPREFKSSEDKLNRAVDDCGKDASEEWSKLLLWKGGIKKLLGIE